MLLGSISNTGTPFCTQYKDNFQKTEMLMKETLSLNV